MVVDQRAALARLDALAATESWRSDKRIRWRAILADLVTAADWTSGLIVGRTVEALAARHEVTARTVRSCLSWARTAGGLVTVEDGASPMVLGLPHGRSATYAVVAPTSNTDSTFPPPGEAGTGLSPQRGTHPRERSRVDFRSWPSHDQARTATERAAATRTLVTRLGLDARRLPDRAVRGALLRWWREGWSVAGLLWAVDHHPDDPARGRGDAMAGATDPVALLGYRLAPWRGRLAELPAAVRAVDPAERQARAADLARRVEAAEHAGRREHVVTAASGPGSARAAALAAVREARVVRHRPTAPAAPSDIVRRPQVIEREHRSRRLT